MKNIYTILFFVVILSLETTQIGATPSSLETTAVETIEFIPDLFYVGDRVELRLIIRTEENLSDPTVEEVGPWLRIHSMNSAKISELTWEVRIAFSNYQPGVITLPAINLGPFKLENIQTQAASVLNNDYSDSETTSPLRKQMRLPGTLSFYLSLLLAALIVPFIVVKSIIRILRSLKKWHEEWARNLPGRLLLTELERIHSKYRNKNNTDEEILKFYEQLSSAIREYLSKKLDIPGHASTTHELNLEMSGLGISSQQVKSITRILETADQVKFAGDYSSQEDIHEIVLTVLPSAIDNIDTLIERRNSNVES